MESKEGSWLGRNLFLVVSIVTGLLFCCAIALITFSRVFTNTLLELSHEGTPKPQLPHEGVFLKIKEGWVELDEVDSIPVGEEISHVSNVIFQKQPGIVVWEAEIDLDNLELYKLNPSPDETRSVIPYNATPNEDGVTELTLPSPLEVGVYCLIHEEPSSAVLSAWCFELGTASEYQLPATQVPIY